jgi:cell division protein FtsL
MHIEKKFVCTIIIIIILKALSIIKVYYVYTPFGNQYANQITILQHFITKQPKYKPKANTSKNINSYLSTF